jgi:hypothetical protein
MLGEAAYLENLDLFSKLRRLSSICTGVLQYTDCGNVVGYTAIATSNAVSKWSDSTPKTDVLFLLQTEFGRRNTRRILLD